MDEGWVHIVGAGAVAIAGGFILLELYEQKKAAYDAVQSAQAEVTSSAEALVSGQTPLALDLGAGGIDSTLPTFGGVPYDPYTGTQSIETDPTTGEIGIGNTYDLGIAPA